MKKIIKSFVAWLDIKFPDKVVVTQADYDNLRNTILALEGIIKDEMEKSVRLEQKMKHAESEISKLNAALGFSRGGQAIISQLSR